MMPTRVLRPTRLARTAAAFALTVLPSAAGPQSPAAAEIDRYMTRAAEYGQFNGAIVVVDGGRIVYERAFGLADMELEVPNTISTRDRAGMAQTGVSLLSPLVPQRAAGYAQSFDGYTNAPHIGVTPAGGLYSTLRDLHRFDQALYGDTLVDERSRSLLFAPRSVATAYGWKTGEDTLPNGTRRRVLRITGGLPGFQALMVRVPEARRTIILLSNVRTIVWRFDDFAVAIGRILDGRPYSMPKRSVAEAVAASMNAGRPATVAVREFDAMRGDTARYALSESEVNQLGYFFLSRGAPSRAVDVFALNVRAFPRSANVYDSLGEAQLARGDTALAVASYRKSLELDPGNGNARNVLSRIAPGP